MWLFPIISLKCIIQKKRKGSSSYFTSHDSLFQENSNVLLGKLENSLVVQWLGLHASTAGAMGLIPICYSSQKKKKKMEPNCPPLE